jgi:alpha-ribazole phosphatase/probable phosphoglycerate mutase
MLASREIPGIRHTYTMSNRAEHSTLYLIRHGETVNSGEKRYKGTIDIPISENGILQIEMTADYIEQFVNHTSSGKGLEAVYTSKLSRAFRSAEIIAERFLLKPVVVSSLVERNFGRWEGMSFDEIRSKYPVEFDAWKNDPLKFSPVDGESTLEVKERVIPAVKGIKEHHSGGHFAIVAHGGVNRVILCHFLQIPLKNIFKIEQDSAALNIIEFTGNYPLLKLLNRAPIK